MKAAEEHAMANADAAAAMGQYMEARQKIETLLEAENPEPEQLKKLSAEMDAYQQRLSLIGDVQALTEARENFSNLIEQVNQVLKFIITGQLAEPKSSCSGHCGCGSTDMLN
jgi:soluble cytochrome b562